MELGETRLNTDDLYYKLINFGPPEIVQNTIDRFHEKKTKKDFLDGYPVGTHIKQYSIQKIVDDYYKPKPTPPIKPTPPPKQKFKLIKQEVIPLYNYDSYVPYILYTYKNEDGTEFQEREKLTDTLVGGKRKHKTYRKKKGKKLRKGISKKKYIKSTRCSR
jgi:hypothetical protein